MYVKPIVPPAPVGINPPSDYDRQHITPVYNGDTIIIDTTAKLPNGNIATPENSILDFAIAETRFVMPIWHGTWRAGIEPKQNGLISIRIPDAVAVTLRRGSYSYSLTIADNLDANKRTVLEGTLLVEVVPTSPNQSIPYKDPPQHYQYAILADLPPTREWPPGVPN